MHETESVASDLNQDTADMISVSTVAKLGSILPRNPIGLVAAGVVEGQEVVTQHFVVDEEEDLGHRSHGRIRMVNSKTLVWDYFVSIFRKSRTMEASVPIFDGNLAISPTRIPFAVVSGFKHGAFSARSTMQ